MWQTADASVMSLMVDLARMLVSIRGYIKLPNPVRETRRSYKWTLEADLNIGVMLGLVTKTNALGVELADGKHC